MPQQRTRRPRRPPAPSMEGDGHAETPEGSGLPDAMIKALKAPPSPYEVRCYNCDTSFAPGTRKCIHCGMRLGRPAPISGSPGVAPSQAGADEEEEELRPGGARSLIWIVTAIAMLVGSALRACQQG